MAAKVFETPELLSIICSHAGSRACVQLLYVSRVGFHAAVPFVWRHVDGVIHLLKLIRQFWLGPGSPGVVTARLFPIILENDLARFQLYAPHVKQLQVYGRKSTFFDFSSWPKLITRLEPGPFLPRLSDLTIYHDCSNKSFALPTRSVMRLTTLLSPSLKSIRLTATTSSRTPLKLSWLAVSTVLQSVVDLCPHLERLSLYFEDPATEVDEPSGEHLLNLLRPRPFHLSLSLLRDLCEVETSLGPLETGALPALGGLPQLKHLTLHPAVSYGLYELVIPDDAFPQLEHLALKAFDKDDVEVILALGPLVQKLTSLEVVMFLEDDIESWVANHFLNFIGDMPLLTNLRASFDEGGDMNGLFSQIHPDALLPFANIPLRTVHLGGVLFAECPDLSNIFPVLTKLAMPDQWGSPSQLGSFATIPNLEHLTLEIKLDDDFDPYFDGKLPACPTLHTLESTIEGSLVHGPEWMHLSTEFLLELFPNLNKVVWPTQDASESAEFKIALALTAHLNLTRELRSRRARIVDAFGQDQADALLPADLLDKIYYGPK